MVCAFKATLFSSHAERALTGEHVPTQRAHQRARLCAISQMAKESERLLARPEHKAHIA